MAKYTARPPSQMVEDLKNGALSLGKAVNPFLDRNGNLKYKILNYQNLLDSNAIGDKVKKYIIDATGLTPSETKEEKLLKRMQNGYSPKPEGPTVNSTSQPSTSQPSTSIVNAAEKYVGTPYVWGGDSMAEGGMDCSGFVYNALKDSGRNVGRTTAEGYRQGGTSVSKENLQPGDLVFYGNGKATHVAVYAGNGKIIHSSGSEINNAKNPGKGVTVTNLDYRGDYLGAKRY